MTSAQGGLRRGSPSVNELLAREGLRVDKSDNCGNFTHGRSPRKNEDEEAKGEKILNIDLAAAAASDRPVRACPASFCR